MRYWAVVVRVHAAWRQFGEREDVGELAEGDHFFVTECVERVSRGGVE